MKLRVAAVHYLNARPLWEALRDDPQVELALDTPRGCADRLAAGRCDVALLPSAELLRRPGLSAVGSSGIAADGPVESVLLLSPVPVEQLEAVRTDPASCTSNALARVLLRDRFGVDVPFLPAAGRPRAPSARQGQVLIGDAALRPPSARVTLDLAEEWRSWTGLPFVFARWTTAATDPPAEWAERLDAAREVGLQARPRLAREAALELGLPEARLRRYLEQRLHYALGPAHEAALRLFAARITPPEEVAA